MHINEEHIKHFEGIESTDFTVIKLTEFNKIKRRKKTLGNNVLIVETSKNTPSTPCKYRKENFKICMGNRPLSLPLYLIFPSNTFLLSFYFGLCLMNITWKSYIHASHQKRITEPIYMEYLNSFI